MNMQSGLLIDDLLKKYQQMTPAERANLDAMVGDRSQGRMWLPTVGPQLDAVNCKADVLLYGGSGGSGKTDLILGLAFTEHQRTLIIRKHYVDLTALTDRAKEINGTEKGYNGSIPPRLRTVNSRLIDFGGLAKPGDEEHWQGQAHDLLAIDEVVQNREKQVRFLMGWVRSAEEGQRCRVVLASNPPTTSAGDWIISMFAPWLDNRYANPAKPGELRWVVTLQDEGGNSFDHWIDGPDVKIDSGRKNPDGSTRYLTPESRTFIPGRLDDNPFLSSDGKYAAKLDALQEPLRSAIRDGNFMAARQDEPDQLIPTNWIRAAQNRWRDDYNGQPPVNVPMCAIGVDAARSKDETVLAPRYDGFYPEVIATPGRQTPHGRDVAALVIKHRKHNAIPVIDCGEMNGAEAFAHLEENGVECQRHVGMDPSVARTKQKQLKFFNKRAEVYYRFMEALDPEQDGGSPIALPDDPQLVSDLTAVAWELTANGIKITPKKDVVAMLGRSPDRGDAVVQSWSAGARSVTHLHEWRKDQMAGTMLGKASRRSAVNLGPRRGGRH
jgi:hypothetical protein